MGEGRVIVFASTIDNVANDFPVKPGFVPFIEQTAAYLGRVEERTSAFPVDSYLDLRADQARAGAVEVTGPKGERALSLKDAANASSLRMNESGFYDVRRGNGRQELVAVNADRRESDLDQIPRENLELWEGTGKAPASSQGDTKAVGAVDPPAPEPQSFWWWVALLAALTLMAEQVFSSRYLQARA